MAYSILGPPGDHIWPYDWWILGVASVFDIVSTHRRSHRCMTILYCETGRMKRLSKALHPSYCYGISLHPHHNAMRAAAISMCILDPRTIISHLPPVPPIIPQDQHPSHLQRPPQPAISRTTRLHHTTFPHLPYREPTPPTPPSSIVIPWRDYRNTSSARPSGDEYGTPPGRSAYTTWAGGEIGRRSWAVVVKRVGGGGCG